jgi:4'-phosphopantetheinyl transferase
MPVPPSATVHVWSAYVEPGRWPDADDLPEAERARAARMGAAARDRWVAARWALRGVLAHYLDRPPETIELRIAERGKPALADPDAFLRFNLSHSGELVLIAVATGREVGVDVQRTGARPAAYYLAWTQQEAIAKCLGSGLWAPLPKASVSVMQIDAQPGYTAALAITGEFVPTLLRFSFAPSDLEA